MNGPIPDPHATPARRRLDGWREIAAYLRCDERTVQRWHQLHGLPVRRPAGRAGARVFAFTDEIDSWLAAQGQLEPEGAVAGADLAPARSWRSAVLALLALAAALLALLLLGEEAAAPAEPASLEYLQQSLAARDAAGRLLWEHRITGRVALEHVGALRYRTHLLDLDGDARTDVLAAVTYYPPEATGTVHREAALLALSSRGEVLWRYAPEVTLAFGAEEFTGPWWIRTVAVDGTGADARIWAAFHHHTWWPSIVVELDAQGQERGRFVNSGYVVELALHRHAGREYLLAGGVNNEWDGGSVAVLPPGGLNGASPQRPGSAFDCRNCGSGRPLLYYVFPRSELNLALGAAPNFVDDIRVLGAEIQAFAVETRALLFKSSVSVIEFSPDLRLVRRVPSDGYWDVHREASRRGLLDHPLEACPERRGMAPARLWRDGAWQEVREE